MLILAIAISKFCQIIILAIVARSILSWFVRAPYGPLHTVYKMLSQITDLIVEPCRRLLSRMGLSTGTIDFSPMVAILLIWLIQDVATSILV